jgi:hypothetical protein
MWTCPKCGEQIEDQFDSCWKCSVGQGKIAAGGGPPAAAGSMLYRVKRDSLEYGPVSREQLMVWIREQHLFPESLAQAVGTTHWQALRNFPEFAEALAAPKIPPSTLAPPFGVGQTPPADFNDYLVRSILVTLFCCLPFGIVAIVYSAQARSQYRAGDYTGAQESARKAKNWGLVAMLCVVAQLLLWAIANNLK